MAGQAVTRQDLDYAVSQAIIDLRQACRKVDSINKFLSFHPSNAVGGDLLTNPLPTASDPTGAVGGFGYTEDEAYLIRIIFEQLNGVRETALPILETGRKLTGLN